jgi:hypothetical protein
MTTGRNDPCPCGSGKKFKKCCLNKGQAFPTPRPVNTGSRLPTDPKPRPATTPPPRPPKAPTRPAPRPRTPEQQRWDAFWKEFESQDDAGRVASFLRMVDDKELLDNETAFEMLQRLHHDAVQHGQPARFAECVAALRERRPDTYQEGAHWYLLWGLQDALAQGRTADVLPLTRELAARIDRDVDIVNRGLDALAYHGQLSALVEAMRLGWPLVKSSTNVVPWGIARFAEKGADYEIYDYLEHTPSPDPADPALLGRIKFFIEDLRPEYLPQLIGDLTGQNAPAWTVDDFALKPPRTKRRDDWDDGEESEPSPDPGAHNLGRLIHQFIGYLRREEGISYARGELVKDHLYQYFLRRHEGDLDPRPSLLEQALHPKKKLPPPPKPGHPLCPERVTLDVHVSSLIGFFNALHHAAAALFELMPAWLRFLESRGLIDAERRLKTIEELRPLQADLLRVWQTYTDDPTLYRAIQAWPV